MSLIVFVVIIGAALLHASWNAMVKGSADKLTSMAAVVFGHAPCAIVALFFVPTPAAESLPYLLAGIGLHFGYQLFLLQSYKLGDLTQVYPIARGSAPLMVAGFSVAVLGVTLSQSELLAIGLIGIGILSLTLVRRADGQRNAAAALAALATGGFIASYSLVDGLGARLAGTSLGFFAWLAIGNSILMALYIAARSPQTFKAVATRGRKLFLIGGSASFIAYALVTWAFTQAPIAVVTALRETSIIFALLIGVFFLKERLDLTKVLSTMVTLIGAALLRYAR
ncbi:EamA-like transporter family protein [Roseovarius albus]|uniref:EamA-like transporter family protein n=1 Tax=Roseovarius albus TaxID=1247867 RepID=A0A1X6YPP1_9RHOB|nr:DMT family transporter [Roseovarius albus]SLN27604.1 EamA-like transporter family protein [Roseovarius albus]